MANIRGLTKKLQTAIAQKDFILRINTYQFYSEEQSRFITGYSVVHKEWQTNKKGKLVLKDKELLNTCSQIEVLNYLAEVYGRLCKEKVKDERIDTKAESLC